MKSRSLLVFVSLVMLLGLLGFQGQRASAAESFTAKWQSNPEGDKIDEGKSKTYDLSIENKGSSAITIKIETSSSGLEIYPKSQEVKGKGGFVAKIKVTMPKSNGATKAYFSITIKSSKGDSKVLKFYIIYRQSCKWAYEWSKYPNGQTVKEKHRQRLQDDHQEHKFLRRHRVQARCGVYMPQDFRQPLHPWRRKEQDHRGDHLHTN